MEAFHLYLQRLLPVAVQVFPESLMFSIRKDGRRKPGPPAWAPPITSRFTPTRLPGCSRPLTVVARRLASVRARTGADGEEGAEPSLHPSGGGSHERGRGQEPCVCVRVRAEPSGIFCSVLRTALTTHSHLAGGRPSSACQISGDTPSADGSCSQPNCTTSRSVNLPL